MAFFSALQRGFGGAIDPMQRAAAQPMVEGMPRYQTGLPGRSRQSILDEKIRRHGINGYGYVPTAEDRNLLARIIYGESLTIPEDFEAIGWATVNRVNRRSYRRTLEGVLRQPNRFTIVSEGRGRRGDHRNFTATEHPERLEGGARERWLRAQEVANGILSGRIPDPTGGATLFFSDDDFDIQRPDTAPGPDFPGMIREKDIVDSRYVSPGERPPSRRRQYFWLERNKPGRLR